MASQKLNPELQKIYDRVMNTYVDKKEEAKPSAAQTESKSPLVATPDKSAASKPSNTFLSSMPLQTPKSFGVKAFTFNGKKKIQKEEKKEEHVEPPKAQKESLSSIAHAPEQRAATITKEPTSKKLLVLVIIGFIIAWGIFWMIILDII